MIAILFLSSVLLLLGQVGCEREHKVHNIVLYPEKHSWCQTTPIQQVVASPGYEPVTIQNNVCVGACFSYSIPKSEPAEPGELIGPYCDSCQPSEIKCYHINLKADESNLEGPKVLQKRIQVIMNCSCQSCDKIRLEDCAINDTNTMELPLSFYVDQDNVNKFTDDYIHPDLFEAQNSHKQHFENDVKLKNKLRKWFETYQSETENKNTELTDLEKVLDIDRKNDKINKDLENLPKSFGSEGVPSHQRGNHIGMGIVHHPNDVVDSDVKPAHHHQEHHQHHSHHHNNGEGEHHHHHYVGEEQQLGLSVAHLVKGPHGSLVAAPNEIKLHIDSDSLKPNDEGLVVEYESHPTKDQIQKVPDLVGTD